MTNKFNLKLKTLLGKRYDRTNLEASQLYYRWRIS